MRIVGFVVFAGCAALLAGCGNSAKPQVVVNRNLSNVTEAQAVHLTKDTQAKIKPGMTLDEVNAAISPLLGPFGELVGLTADEVGEVGWHDPKSKKAIIVKIKGQKVTGTSTLNIPKTTTQSNLTQQNQPNPSNQHTTPPMRRRNHSS